MHYIIVVNRQQILKFSAWDEFADITSDEYETIQNEDLLQFDFISFFVDNAELASICTGMC